MAGASRVKRRNFRLVSTRIVRRHAAARIFPPGFALAAAVMCLDEPFGALDALTRLQMQRWLLSLWEEHRRSVLL